MKPPLLKRSSWWLPAASLLLTLAALSSPSLHAQSGPTPYPDQNDLTAWPGVGNVRTYPYMTDNRTYFWTQREKEQNGVVFVGDSLFGNWYQSKVKIKEAFPEVKHIVNRAIGGDTSRGVLFRFQEDVLDLHPTAVIILVGTNDLSSKDKTDNTVANLSSIIDAAHKENPAMPIVLCNIPPRAIKTSPIDSTQITELNQKIETLAKSKEHVTYFDTFTLFALPDGQPDPAKYKADMIHFNDEGYAKLSEALGKVFVEQKIQ